MGGAESGHHGFDRITDTDGIVTGTWDYIMPVNGNVSLGAGTAVHAGDPPDTTDILTQDVAYPGPWSAIEVGTAGGVIYAYRDRR